MGRSTASYFSSAFATRLDHQLDKTPVTPSEADSSASYDPSDDGDYRVEVVKDVLNLGAKRSPASSINDEVTSESSLSETDGEGAGEGVKGFVDPYPDFQWQTTEEPHRSRRMAILKAHPEIRKLMGPTKWTLPVVVLVLSIQLASAYSLRHTSPLHWTFILSAYVIGGTANQNTFLAIHEITHNLAFRSIRANKVLAIVANMAIGVPYAMAFKGYHIEHHKFLGEDGIDTDLPSRFEAVVLNNVAGKTFFATFQILFYALRPGFIRSQRPTLWHAYNFLSIIAFDFALVHFWGKNALIYLIMSSFFAGSLHPCAAHFIAEHYLMNDEEVVPGSPQDLAKETTSYYGWLNVLCYNVGYHNEHHDFPSIPWTRLPALRAAAKEFYEPLPAHTSWPYVTWKFITDPSVGMWSRAKRDKKGEKMDERVWTRMAGLHTEDAVRADASEAEEEERAYASDSDERVKMD